MLARLRDLLSDLYLFEPAKVMKPLKKAPSPVSRLFVKCLLELGSKPYNQRQTFNEGTVSVFRIMGQVITQPQTVLFSITESSAWTRPCI